MPRTKYCWAITNSSTARDATAAKRKVPAGLAVAEPGAADQGADGAFPEPGPSYGPVPFGSAPCAAGAGADAGGGETAGTACTAATPVLATSTNVKTIAITMAGTTSHVVILDFANGTFAPGTSTTPGITVAFGGGTSADAFKLRGAATTGDLITAGINNGGAHAIAFNTDAYADVVLSGLGTAVTYTFSARKRLISSALPASPAK